MAIETGYGLRVAPVSPSNMIFESEEERRRREERERLAAGARYQEPILDAQGNRIGFRINPAVPESQLVPPTQPLERIELRPQTVQETVAGARNTANQILAQPPIDYNNLLNVSQTNQGLRLRLAQDPNAPADVRAVARDQERANLQNQQRQIEAQRTLASGDPNKMVGAIKPGDDGSYLRLLAFKALGMTNLALNEERKLGAGQTVETLQSPDGKSRARITFNGLGQPVSGYDQTGRPLNDQELLAYSTFRPDTGSTAGLPQKGELFVDREGYAFREVFNPQRPTQPDLVPITPGRTPVGQLIRSTQDYGLAASQAGGRAYGGAVVEQTGQIPVALPPGATIPPNQGQGTAPGPVVPGAATTPVVPGQGVVTSPVVRPNVQAAPLPAGPAAPAAPAQAAPAPAPAAPVAPGAPRPNIVATTPQLSPVVGGGGGGAPAARPAAGGIVPPGQYKTQQEIAAAAGKEAIETAETEPRENIKLNTAAAGEAAKKARSYNAESRTLDSIIQYTETKPQFFGAWIGSEAYRAFATAQTDDARRAALDRLAQTANIPKEDRAEFQKLVNDIRRVELSGITGSGLTASQLNTERESQRALSAYAVSIADTPQAARAQAMIAKAQVEYQRELAKYYGTANKRLSPAVIQENFDRTKGDAIYNRLREDLEKMRPAPAAGNAQPGGGGITILNRRPVQ